MAALTAVPIELLHLIFSHAEKQSRGQLRLTSRLLAGVGEPWVFQQVRVSPTLKSYERLERILENDHLSRHIAKVYLDIRKWHPARTIEGYDSDEEVHEEEREIGDWDDDVFPGIEDHCLPTRFMAIVERLRARSLVLRFHPKASGRDDFWVAERWDGHGQHYLFRLNVMRQVVSSLSSWPRGPCELAIQDLLNIYNTDPDIVAMITRVLGGLRSLRLNISNQYESGTQTRNPVNAPPYDEPHAFYQKLPSFWLKPTTSNLRHLTLYSGLYFGFYPKFDLRGIHFPQLKTLSLGNHTFIHDSQLDWILLHGATLTELYLDDCPILFEVSICDKERTYLAPDAYSPSGRELFGEHHAAYGARWCDYFRAFGAGLPRLRHFRYGSSPWWWVDGTTPFECETSIAIGLRDDSYMVYCDGLGDASYRRRMVYWDGPESKYGKSLEPSEEDRTALQELLVKIGQRRLID